MWLERLYRPLDLKNDVMHKPAEIRFSYRCSTYLKFKPWFIFRGKKFALGYFLKEGDTAGLGCFPGLFWQWEKNGRQLHLPCPLPPSDGHFGHDKQLANYHNPPQYTHTRAREVSGLLIMTKTVSDLPSPHLKKKGWQFTPALSKNNSVQDTIWKKESCVIFLD